MKRIFFKKTTINKKQNFQDFSKLSSVQLLSIRGGENPPEGEGGNEEEERP